MHSGYITIILLLSSRPRVYADFDADKPLLLANLQLGLLSATELRSYIS